MKKDKNQSQFRVPPEYFESFEDRLEPRILEESLPESSGFTAPDGYFERLSQKLVRSAVEKPAGRVVPMRRAIWWAAAAIAALVVLIGFPWETNQPYSLSDIDSALIQEYIDRDGIDLSSNDIMGLLNEEEIKLLSEEFELIDQELLEEYLMNEIEYNNIITE